MKKFSLAFALAGLASGHALADDVFKVRVAKMERYTTPIADCNPSLTRETYVKFKYANGEIVKVTVSGRNEEWFLLHESLPGYKDILAMLLTATTADLPLNIKYSTSGGNCSAKMPILGVSIDLE